MHAVKVSWVGQPFALAKCNDSGGKKSRIRRSKEERKTMVESFIKKYQTSNNGSFPSLNLTHKEVGGSFYTVREIVREIIQENRVLGPAKWTSEERYTDQFSEQYPLGSMSTEPQISLASKETCLHNDHQSVGEENSTSSLDSSKYINGNWADEEYKELGARELSENGVLENQMDDEPMYSKFQDNKNLDGVKKVVDASTSKVTSIGADTIVETFPLRTRDKTTTNYVNGMSDEASDLTKTLEEHVTKEVSPGNGVSMLDIMNSTEKNSSDMENDKATSKLSMEESSDDLENDKARSKLADPLPGTVSCFTDGENNMGGLLEAIDSQVDVSDMDILNLQKSDQNQSIPGAEPQYVPNDVQVKNVNTGNTSHISGVPFSQEAVLVGTEANIRYSDRIKEDNNSTLNIIKQPVSPEAVLVERKDDIQLGGDTKEGSNSTLNRINLESWEGTSKNSSEAETNPVWKAFKSFITAFLKFWSE